MSKVTSKAKRYHVSFAKLVIYFGFESEDVMAASAEDAALKFVTEFETTENNGFIASENERVCVDVTDVESGETIYCFVDGSVVPKYNVKSAKSRNA